MFHVTSSADLHSFDGDRGCSFLHLSLLLLAKLDLLLLERSFVLPTDLLGSRSVLTVITASTNIPQTGGDATA